MRSHRIASHLLAGVVSILFLLLAGCNKPSAKERAAEAGYAFLASIQRADGAICDTVNPLFDVWETALAAKAMYAVRKDSTDPALRRALAFLRAHENAAGLVCHNQKCRASYCLETSAIYLGLLADLHGNAYIASRLDTVARLQKPTGQWEIGNPDVTDRKDFPSVTGFVWWLLLQAQPAAERNDSAYHWLLAQQNADGSWGKTWEYYNLPGYALWPILGALHDYDPEAAHVPLPKAIHYITTTQQPDGSWGASDPAFPKMPSAALHTALMVAALQASGQSESEATKRGEAYLLAQQRPDGSWDGGYFPIANARYAKAEYVFGTALGMLVLGGNAF